MREWTDDGYRKCSTRGCNNMIGQCMGSVLAGDLLLALEGKLPPGEVRERCGTCALRGVLRREGHYGPYVQIACYIYDLFRWVSWRLQMRFRKARYPVLNRADTLACSDTPLEGQLMCLEDGSRSRIPG